MLDWYLQDSAIEYGIINANIRAKNYIEKYRTDIIIQDRSLPHPEDLKFTIKVYYNCQIERNIIVISREDTRPIDDNIEIYVDKA